MIAGEMKVTQYFRNKRFSSYIFSMNFSNVEFFSSSFSHNKKKTKGVARTPSGI